MGIFFSTTSDEVTVSKSCFPTENSPMCETCKNISCVCPFDCFGVQAAAAIAETTDTPDTPDMTKAVQTIDCDSNCDSTIKSIDLTVKTNENITYLEKCILLENDNFQETVAKLFLEHATTDNLFD